MSATPKIITWDWKAQPPWDDIQDALDRTYTDGSQIFEVDTQSDEFGIVIAERTLGAKAAQTYYEEHWND